MKKILMIDDDRQMCLYVRESLEVTGKYKVIVVTNPRLGLSAAKDNSPDLILLDVIMPLMSGFDVLKQLKGDTKTASIPVVMLTAVGAEEAKEEAVRLYNEDYIVKPVSISTLIQKIDAVLSRRPSGPS